MMHVLNRSIAGWPFWIAVAAMVIVVTGSNVLVQYPVNDWLTWGAFSYPLAFLVTDATNRTLGPGRARLVVIAGFVIAVAFSIYVATPRIAIASGSAFLVAQFLDIAIFNRLRRSTWWRAPLFSSLAASFVDTLLFFGIAFAATGLPWVSWAVGDYAVKILMAAIVLVPYRGLVTVTDPFTLAPAQD